MQRQASPNIVICLVGNKLDLSASREVPTSEASAYAQESGLLFIEASAKTGENVVEIFSEIAKKIPLDTLVASRSRSGVNQRVNLTSQPQSVQDDKCACWFYIL